MFIYIQFLFCSLLRLIYKTKLRHNIKVLVLNPYITTYGGGEKHMLYLCHFIEKHIPQIKTIDIIVPSYSESQIDEIRKILTERFNIQLENLNFICIEDRNITNVLKTSKHYDIFINFMYMSVHMSLAKVNIYQVMFPPSIHIIFNKIKHSKKYKYLSPVLFILKPFIKILFLSNYDYFICNSDYSAHWFRTYWGKIKKCHTIPPPVYSISDYSSDQLAYVNKQNIILSVGRFFANDHCKKQDFLVDFFLQNEKVFNDYTLILVGQVNFNNHQDVVYVENIKNKIKQNTNVILKLGITTRELLSLYHKAKIFWHATGYGQEVTNHPENFEHFGISTCEAMKYGLIPIVINNGGQQEIVQHNHNGFLWNNENEFLEYNKKAMQLNEEDYLLMVNHSIQRSKEYTIEKFNDRNLRVFNQFVLPC